MDTHTQTILKRYFDKIGKIYVCKKCKNGEEFAHWQAAKNHYDTTHKDDDEAPLPPFHGTESDTALTAPDAALLTAVGNPYGPNTYTQQFNTVPTHQVQDPTDWSQYYNQQHSAGFPTPAAAPSQSAFGQSPAQHYRTVPVPAMTNTVSQASQLHQMQQHQQPQQQMQAGLPQQQALSIGGAPGQHGMNAAQAAPAKYNVGGYGAYGSGAGGPIATGSSTSNTSQGASANSYTSRVILIMNIPVHFTISSVFTRVRQFGNSELTMIEPTVVKVRFEQLNDAVRAKNTIQAEEGCHGIFVVYSNKYL